MSEPTLKVTEDFTRDFNEIIQKFKNDQILVGVPQEDSNRKDPDETINNATLLAINNFGSPANNIPPRPVLEIGIRNAQDEIAVEFKKAAIGALTKGVVAVDQYYEKAGMIAANAVKKAINAQEGFDGPSKATLRARKAKKFKGTKALIVTGQLRNSITYQVKRWR